MTNRQQPQDNLESEKAILQPLISSLQTQEGANDFVAQHKQIISAYLPKLGSAMKKRAMMIKDKLDNRPNEFVAEEIQKAQKRLAGLDKQSAESIEWQRQ